MRTSGRYTTERYRLSELITLLGDEEVRLFAEVDTEGDLQTTRRGFDLGDEAHRNFENWRSARRAKHDQLLDWERLPLWKQWLLRRLGKDYRHKPARTPGGWR